MGSIDCQIGLLPVVSHIYADRVSKSVRFVGLANNLGTLLSTWYREGLTPLMTKEETQHYALQAVLRAAIREDFISKLGRLKRLIHKD